MLMLALLVCGSVVPPAAARLPELRSGARHWSRNEVVVLVSRTRHERTFDEQVCTVALADGTLFTSTNESGCGAPYTETSVDPWRLATVLRQTAALPALPENEALVPDGNFRSLLVRAPSGAGHTRLATTYDDQERWPERFAPLRARWLALRETVKALGTGTAKAELNATFDWGSLLPLEQATLALRFDGKSWNFELTLDGATKHFADVASLQAWAVKQPAGTWLLWDAGCKRTEGMPLLNDAKALQTFQETLARAHVTLVMAPGG